MKLCKRGHLQTKENTYLRLDGYSQCKICTKLKAKQWQKENREKHIQSIRKWVKTSPWYNHYIQAKYRCNNKNNNRFHSYGRRGIKFLMTMKDFEFL